MEEVESQRPPLLQMRDICKRFPGVQALDHVCLTVRHGEVHALMGENGAGKSTLMKCLFGVYGKDSGEILLEGEAVSFHRASDALRGGVAMVHQELNQAAKRSIADNVWLGRFPRRWGTLPFVDGRRLLQMTADVLSELGIDEDPRTRIGELPVSRRQMVEIAKAVSYRSRLIVFDEPTSSLNGEEAEQLFRIIALLRDRGVGIIYISHKMEEILRICDTVTVMRDGHTVATRPASTLSTDELIRLMVGRELTNRYPPRRSHPSHELLQVEGLSASHNLLQEVSFTLRAGEILGVAGLDGAGRTELLEALYGLSARREGRLLLRGEPIANRTPREAIRNGFALVTEERRATGIFGIRDITANTVIASLRRYRLRPLPLLSEGRMRSATEEQIRRLRIKTPSPTAKIRTLSGGNQQKVIFARWLLTEPTVFLLDEPTRGIDVGAKYEIYQLIGELAERGKGVLVVSSEMPELLGITDRILVMSGGRMAGILQTQEATQERIMQLATRFV